MQSGERRRGQPGPPAPEPGHPQPCPGWADAATDAGPLQAGPRHHRLCGQGPVLGARRGKGKGAHRRGAHRRGGARRSEQHAPSRAGRCRGGQGLDSDEPRLCLGAQLSPATTHDPGTPTGHGTAMAGTAKAQDEGGARPVTHRHSSGTGSPRLQIAAGPGLRGGGKSAQPRKLHAPGTRRGHGSTGREARWTPRGQGPEGAQDFVALAPEGP